MGDAFGDWIAGLYPDETDPDLIALDADPEGDGILNIVEFAFGLDPTQNDVVPFTPLETNVDPGDPSQRELRFVRPTGLQGVNYVMEQADSLGNWSAMSGPPQVTDIGNGQEEVVYQDNEPLGPSGTRFYRLGVQAVP